MRNLLALTVLVAAVSCNRETEPVATNDRCIGDVVAVSQQSLQLAPSEERTITARVNFACPLVTDSILTWTSSNANVVSVRVVAPDSAVVTAISEGTARVVVSASSANDLARAVVLVEVRTH